MMETYSDIVVRYAETDQMGIAHHSNYAIWFEAARTDYIKALGISYTECEKRGIRLPLFSLEVNYIRPAYYEDVVTIKTYIIQMSKTRLVMGYTVYNKSTDELLAEGKTHHAWTNEELRPVNLLKYDKEVYQLLLNGWC